MWSGCMRISLLISSIHLIIIVWIQGLSGFGRGWVTRHTWIGAWVSILQISGYFGRCSWFIYRLLIPERNIRCTHGKVPSHNKYSVHRNWNFRTTWTMHKIWFYTDVWWCNERKYLFLSAISRNVMFHQGKCFWSLIHKTSVSYLRMCI